MINTYEEAKQKAFIKILEGAADYWKNELAKTQSVPYVRIDPKISKEDIERVKETLSKIDKYPRGGTMENLKAKRFDDFNKSQELGLDGAWLDESNTISQESFDKLKKVDDGQIICPNPETATHVLDAYQYAIGYDMRNERLQKYVRNLSEKRARTISIDDLLTEFLKDKEGGNITPLFVEFAKLVRVLTVEETTNGISARLTRSEANGFCTTAVPWIDHRPDENNIQLPKDFKI